MFKLFIFLSLLVVAPAVRAGITYEMDDLGELANEVLSFKAGHGQGFRYDSYTVTCDAPGADHKCLRFDYQAYVPGEYDIIGKNVVRKFLWITSKRTVANNPDLGKYTDPSEVITGFSLHGYFEAIPHSALIGATKEQVASILSVFKSDDKIHYRGNVADWSIVARIEDDKLTELLFER